MSTAATRTRTPSASEVFAVSELASEPMSTAATRTRTPSASEVFAVSELAGEPIGTTATRTGTPSGSMVFAWNGRTDRHGSTGCAGCGHGEVVG